MMLGFILMTSIHSSMVCLFEVELLKQWRRLSLESVRLVRIRKRC